MGGRLKRQGYSKPRKYANGVQRWTALYLIVSTGEYLSAGTFDSWEESEAAWQDTLSQMRRGLMADPRKGRMPFADYAAHFQTLMTHQKVNTVKNIRTHCNSELIPFFGEILLREITTEHVMRWVTAMREKGRAAATIRTYKATLSGMLTAAVRLGYIPFNPALNVKTPKEKPRRIKAVAGHDIQALMKNLPGPASRMLVHLDVSTGCRWGEISELRGKDVRENPDTPGADYLDLQRAVVDAGPDHPEATPGVAGHRYFVEDTTKNGQDRRLGLSVPVSRALRDYMTAHEIGPEDLLFPYSRLLREWEDAQPEPSGELEIVPDNLGFTEPNAQGRVYRHASLSGYTAGKCKCPWCRRSYANYRADRRAAGKPDRPIYPSKVVRSVNTSDHLGDDWFREKIYYPAAEAAGIGRRITFHDLRHTHATWLARDPRMDIMTLKERMGHRSLDTTLRYIDDADIIETTSGDIVDEILAGAVPQRRSLKVVR